MQKDPTPVGVDTNKPAAAYRPNLSQSMYVANDDERILSSLKMPSYDAGQSAATPKKSLFKFAVLALAVGAAVFVGYQSLATNPKSDTPPIELAMAGGTAASQKSNPIIEEKAESATPVTPLVPAPVTPAPAAAEAAQIINEAPAATNSAKLTEALEEGVKPPKAALQKALEVKSPATSAAATVAAPKVAAEPAAPRATAPAVAKATPPVATALNKPTSEADKDINLIAALLTHNNTTVAPTAKPTAANTEAKKPNATASADKPLLMAAAPAAQSTETLLKQCAELGFIEREVCKMKTCSNLWSTDAACKATLPSAK